MEDREPFLNIEVGCCELRMSKPCKIKTAGLMKKEFGTLGRKLNWEWRAV